MIQSRLAILLLLTGLNLVNYLDRYLVMAVSPRIQVALKLDDAQLGWVGSAFMLGYFLTSPIFGWLGDRYPRKALIAGGIAIWSAATALSGLADSFETMILARVAVGVGEASYATLSPTIIDDISTPANKNRWIAIFYVAIPVGSALGFLLGGALEHAFGWRYAFFIAGGPGLVLALITLLIREPAAAPRPTGVAAKAHGYRELLKRPAYMATVAGYIAQTFALGGFTFWAASFLYRKLCLELHVADFYFGLITVVTGLGGTALGGFIADRWPGADRTRVALRICAWSSLAGAPIALVALLLPSATGFLVALGVTEMVIFASIAPTNVAVMRTVPTHLRARAMAASIFAIHLLGDLISPPLIGQVSASLGDSPEACSGARGLQMGMYLLPAALAISAVFWWRASSRPVEVDDDDVPSATPV